MLTQRRKNEIEARIEDLRAGGNDKLANVYQAELERQQNLSNPAKCEQILTDHLAMTDPLEKAHHLAKYSAELSAAIDNRRKEGRGNE